MKLIAFLSFFVLVVSGLHSQTQSEISFSKDIFSLVKSKCLKCHEKDDDNPNSFAMDNLGLMKNSGKTKNMIIPGNGKESYLVIKLLPDPPKGAQMPIFSKKKLSDEEIGLFIRWIDEGANDN
jgi:hypothetical protein